MESQLKTVQLSPSDFAFLYDECPRCFWLKTAAPQRSYRPFTPLSGIFNKIDDAMKHAVEGRHFNDIDPSFPNCSVLKAGGFVQSMKIPFPDLNVELFIKGKYDTLTFEEATDAIRQQYKLPDDQDRTYGVIDFKSTFVKPEHLLKYSRQLHAYAYSIMRPAEHMPKYSPVTRLGLLVFEPYADGFKFTQNEAVLGGGCQWVPIEMDKPMFTAFLREVAELVARDTPPPAGHKCEFCSYLREHGVEMEVAPEAPLV